MVKSFFIFIFSIVVNLGFTQNNLDGLLEKHNTKKVPYMLVQELALSKTNTIILDAREQNEYNISHIKDAIHVGYNHFNIDTTRKKITDKNKPIVVYCSLGIRSEKIAYQLKKGGYKNILNLYGGIFEWKNNNFIVYNSEEKETENIHTYNKNWSIWLKKGIKIYD